MVERSNEASNSLRGILCAVVAQRRGRAEYLKIAIQAASAFGKGELVSKYLPELFDILCPDGTKTGEALQQEALIVSDIKERLAEVSSEPVSFEIVGPYTGHSNNLLTPTIKR